MRLIVPRTSGMSRRLLRYDPEHGEPGGHPLELFERRVLVDRQMGSGNGRTLQVKLQHGRAAIRCDFFQAHLLTTTMTSGRLMVLADCRPGTSSVTR
jgi:hypothetical protein